MKYLASIFLALALQTCSLTQHLGGELEFTHELMTLTNGETLSLNIMPKETVDLACSKRHGNANACWVYYPSKRLHIVYSIPIQECVDHEMRHVEEGQWHPEGWIDSKCNDRANVYYGNQRDKTLMNSF